MRNGQLALGNRPTSKAPTRDNKSAPSGAAAPTGEADTKRKVELAEILASYLVYIQNSEHESFSYRGDFFSAVYDGENGSITIGDVKKFKERQSKNNKR